MNIKITNKPNDTLYIYCRVSTSGQEKDGVSLDVQEERGLQVSKQLGLSSIVIKEQGSGLKPYLEERPLFTELMKSVSFGDVKHIWIDTDNRLTRHEVDEPFIKNKLKSNYTVSIFINLIYSILIIPAIFLMKNGIFCKYYSLVFFGIYLLSYNIAHEKNQ